MKNIILLLLTLSSLFQLSCHQEIFIDEESEIATKYKNYKVDFFTSHMDFEIREAVFKSVTEQMLVKEAHRVGATFETFTEQVLVKESYTSIQLAEVQTMDLVVNAETNIIDEISCYHFLDLSEFTIVEFPAEYSTVTGELLLVDGNGAEVPATYMNRAFKILETPFELIEFPDERTFLQVSFRIPDNISIEEYLANQFSSYSLSNCMEYNSYRIVE